jgi:hypothetical protein
LRPSYEADISYLDNASSNFLAAKLARLGRVEEKAEEGAPKENEVLTTEENPPIVSRPIPTSEDIAALTAQRREERISRAADGAHRHLLNYVPIPEKSNLLRTEFAKSNVFMSPEKTQPPRRANLYRRPPQFRGADPRGAKGVEERSPQRKGRPRKRQAPVASTPTQGSNSETLSQQIEDGIDEAVFQSGHEPDLKCPERPSSNLLEHFGPSFSAKGLTVVLQCGTAIQVPVSKIDSFHKGSYAKYVRDSDYTSPPNILGAVKVAERTLSHQPHYNLTAQDRTLEIVARASQSSKPNQN